MTPKRSDQHRVRGGDRARIVSAAGILVCVVLVLTAVAVFVAHISAERTTALSDWRNRLGAVSGARKQAVQAWLAERRADAQVLAWAPELVGVCVEQACPRGVDLSGSQTQLDNLTLYSGYLGVYLFSPGGAVILYPQAAGPPCVGVSQRALDVAAQRVPLLDDIRRGSDCDGLMLGFLSPVFRRASHAEKPSQSPVVGVVGLYVHPEKTLFPVVSERAPVSNDVQVYLVRKEGGQVRILSPTHLGGDDCWTLFAPANGRHSIELAAASGQEREGLFTDYRGRQVVGAIRWIPEAGWGLVATVGEGAALQAWRRGAIGEALLAGLSLACLGLVAVGAWRGWAARRYRELTEGLRDREERLRAVAFGTDDLIFVKDLELRHLLANPAAARALGVNASQTLGKRASDFSASETAELMEDRDREVLASGQPTQREDEIRIEGTLRTFLSARIPLRDAGGTVQGVAGVLRDITDRKRAEEMLERRAKSLAALYRLSESFAAAQDTDAVVRATIKGTLEASGADWVVVFLAEGDRLRSAGARNVPPEHERLLSELGPGQGVSGRVFRTAKSEFVANYASDPDALPSLAASEKEFSLAGIPLLVEGRVGGVLTAASRERHEFSDEERGLLEALANMAGVALGRARALEHLVEEAGVRRRAEGRLRVLHESTAGLTGENLFRQAAKALIEELGAGWVEVSRVLGGKAHPIVMYRGEGSVVRSPFDLEGTPCGPVAGLGRSVLYPERAWEAFPEARFLQVHKIEFYAGAPLVNSQGVVIGVLCAFDDAPHAVGPGEKDLLELYARRVGGEVERLEAERELVEARRALETLIRNIPGAVYRCSGTALRQIEFVSPGCQLVSDYDVESLTGENGPGISGLIVAEDRARVGRDLEEALEAAAPFEIEYRIHDRKGDIRWVYDVGRVVENDAGERFIEGVLLDQTERRVLEGQLTHSQRMEALGRLAGGVAHDFNNLITAISGYAEILLRRFPEGDRSLRPLREIIRASDRAAELTHQLLAFSRHQAVEPKILDFNEAVDGVIRMLGRLLGEDVLLEVDLAADAGSVRADPGQLEQVVLNLCVNARDALPQGGCLRVLTRRELLGETERRPGGDLPAGEYAVLEVSDTGVGMPPDVLDHIFEPFFTTKDPGKGTGLGLATVYGVVKQAGGDVVVTSVPGKGTTFLIYWPRKDGKVSVAKSVGVEPGVPGRGETVLLVEDDESVRRLSAEHLQDMGFRVMAASTAPEALDILATSGVVDILVTDVVMPGMSGLDLARQVRSRWPALPVIFVSGHTGEALLENGIAAEGSAFVQKPFRLDELTRVVGAALGR